MKLLEILFMKYIHIVKNKEKKGLVLEPSFFYKIFFNAYGLR